MKLKTVLCLALVGAAVAADPSTSDATGGATGAAGNDGLKSVVADLERGKSEFVSSYAKITVGRVKQKVQIVVKASEKAEGHVQEVSFHPFNRRECDSGQAHL